MRDPGRHYASGELLKLDDEVTERGDDQVRWRVIGYFMGIAALGKAVQRRPHAVAFWMPTIDLVLLRRSTLSLAPESKTPPGAGA